MSGAILSHSDGVVGEDVDRLVLRKGSEAHRTITIRQEGKESGAERDATAISVDAIIDCTHGMLCEKNKEIKMGGGRK